MAFEQMWQQEALDALARSPTIFVHGGRLCEIIERPTPAIIPLTSASTTIHLNKDARWSRRVSEMSPCGPSTGISNTVIGLGHWPEIQTLTGLTSTPLLRRDGSLLSEAGYDESSSFLYEPAGTFDIPAAPTREDAQQALALLLTRFQEIPFETATHRSAFLAALLTPFAAHWSGPAPLFFFDAPNSATPTLLGDLISLLAHGREIIQMEKPASERSFRRLLARTQLNGESLVLISGAETWRNGDALRTALFSRTWIDGNERRRDPRPITWCAAGANAQLTRDVAMLTLPVRLEGTEDDMTGESWGLPPDLVRNLRRDRAELVSAALTILRAYEVAGRPDQELDVWTGFEEWSSRIAGALVWAGAENPLDARRTARDDMSLEDLADLRMVFVALNSLERNNRGLLVSELIDELKKNQPSRDPFRNALSSLLPGGWDEPRRVAALLKKHRGRTLKGLKLEKHGEDWNGYAIWAVRPRHSPYPVKRSRTDPESAESIHARPHEHIEREPYVPGEPTWRYPADYVPPVTPWSKKPAPAPATPTEEKSDQTGSMNAEGGSSSPFPRREGGQEVRCFAPESPESIHPAPAANDDQPLPGAERSA
jgi:hypothetical protein